MYKNILVLDDGTEVSAGTVGQNAIVSMTWTENVSKTTDLAPGAACANKIEAVIWVEPGNDLLITSGTRLRYYRETPAGQRTLAGTFWAVKPTRQTRNTYKVFAYDVVSKLDGIQSSWLMDNQSMFPLTIWQFAQKVAARCGVTITNTSLPRNGSYMVQAFYADDLTGRQLLAWAAEASGTFLRATPDSQIEFAWYTLGEDGISRSPDGKLATVVLADGATLYTSNGELFVTRVPTPYYYKGSLAYEDYMTAPIDKVQIKSTDEDVGAIYPPDETGANTWVISGNLLLSPTDADALAAAAQALWPVMNDVTYRPCSFTCKDDDALQVGQIVEVEDAKGNSWRTYLMSAEHSAGRVKFTATGNSSRDSTAAVNQQSFTNLQGKVLELQMGVDGLRITNRDLQGQMASLELTVDGFETQISGKLDEIEAETLIQQSLDSLTLSATAGDQSSTLTLRAGDTLLSSAEITFEGMVTFAALSGSGTSVINGDNITTGQIGSASGNTLYDLDAGTLRTGRSSGNHVNINDRGITWYVLNGSTSYLTGVLYSVYGESWIGANSNYVNYGWVNSATPSSYRGMRVDNTGSRVSFNTSHVDVESGDLGVSGGISTRDLNAWGSKYRIVRTHLGNLAFAAMESPEPAFCDWGGGEVGEEGICPIVLTPEYAAAITGQMLRWLVTPVGGDGDLWVERTDCGALVHGKPGSRFDWLCIGVQRDMAGLYAPVSGTAPPPERDDAAELAKTASMAEEISEHDYYKEADIA